MFNINTVKKLKFEVRKLQNEKYGLEEKLNDLRVKYLELYYEKINKEREFKQMKEIIIYTKDSRYEFKVKNYIVEKSWLILQFENKHITFNRDCIERFDVI